MIKEVIVICLMVRDRRSEKDGRDRISISKFSLLTSYMMILMLRDTIIPTTDSLT